MTQITPSTVRDTCVNFSHQMRMAAANTAIAAKPSAFGATFETGQTLSGGVLNRMKQLASTDQGIDVLSNALTGMPAAQLPTDQRVALNAVFAGLAAGSINPTVHRGSFADASVDGLFVAKDNAILLSNSLSGAELTATVTEETGEAVAAFAAKKGLVLQPGDVGARLAAALRGDEAAPADSAARPSDSAATTFTTDAGEEVSVSGAARKAVKGTNRGDRLFVNDEVDHKALGGNDRVIVFPGEMTDFTLDGGSGNDVLHIAGLTKEKGNNITVHQIGENEYRIFVKTIYDGNTVQNSYFDIKNFERVIEGPSGKAKKIADFVKPYLEK